MHMTFAIEKSELLHTIPARSNARFKQESRNTALAYTSANDQLVTLAPTPSIRYLGVILDKSLTFSTHAKTAASNGLQALGSLSALRKRSWGIPSRIAHHVTFAAILPKMLWASPTWWNGKPGVIDPLNLVYNTIARWITGLPSNTRTTKLLQAAHLPPLNLYLDYLSSRYAVRTLFLPENHILTITPQPITNNLSQNTPGRHILLDKIKHLITLPLENRKLPTYGNIEEFTPFIIIKSADAKKTHAEWVRTLPLNVILAYSDGSKMPKGGTGSGWAIYQKGVQELQLLVEGCCCLGQRAEVYDAELHAIEEALQAIINLQLPPDPPRTIYILTDNQAAIQCLVDNSQNSQYARNAIHGKNQLDHPGWLTQAIWVPSHTDIEGNEKADKLAKLGTTLAQNCQHATTTKTWMLRETRKIFFDSWTKALPNAYPPSFTYPTSLSNMKWKTSKALAGLQCGRTPCDPYPNAPNTVICRCEGDTLSSKHLITSCPIFKPQRHKWLDKCNGLPSDEGFLFNLKNVDSIVKFMAATGIGYQADPSRPASINN
jgi:ribonuclease HI